MNQVLTGAKLNNMGNYGLFKCRYTTNLLQSTEGVSYMILKNITEKVKSVSSSVWQSLSGKALLFHIMLPNGAVFYRLPISAFFKKHISRSEVPDMSVDSLQLWNCFSYILVCIALIGYLA
jgi:hypothetical protein